MGCTHSLTSFQRRLRNSQSLGLTRLEISICSNAFQKYDPFQPSCKTLWHQKIEAYLFKIGSMILNDPEVKQCTYRELSLSRVMAYIADCSTNILAIGRSYAWLINSSTVHQRHYMGTRLTVGISTRAKSEQRWEKLREFVLRYAAPGSTILVYHLIDGDNLTRPVAQVKKTSLSFVQMPGCSLASSNGIKTP